MSGRDLRRLIPIPADQGEEKLKRMHGNLCAVIEDLRELEALARSPLGREYFAKVREALQFIASTNVHVQHHPEERGRD